jgi:tetratricopeptide (TPR) repeat protein
MGKVVPVTPERALILKEAAMKKVVLVLIAILALCAMPGQSAATGNGEYDSALKAYYSGHYKKAVADLKDYVNRKPDAAAYYLIGYGLYKLGKYKEATEYFDQSYLIDPTFSPEEIGFEKFGAGMTRKACKRAGVRKKTAVPKKEGGRHF